MYLNWYKIFKLFVLSYTECIKSTLLGVLVQKEKIIYLSSWRETIKFDNISEKATSYFCIRNKKEHNRKICNDLSSVNYTISALIIKSRLTNDLLLSKCNNSPPHFHVMCVMSPLLRCWNFQLDIEIENEHSHYLPNRSCYQLYNVESLISIVCHFITI